MPLNPERRIQFYIDGKTLERFLAEFPPEQRNAIARQAFEDFLDGKTRRAPGAQNPPASKTRRTTIKFSNTLSFSICRFNDVVCSQCGKELKGKGAITKRMNRRRNKKHTKYYCMPYALKLHVVTMKDHRTHGIKIPEKAP